MDADMSAFQTKACFKESDHFIEVPVMLVSAQNAMQFLLLSGSEETRTSNESDLPRVQ
jgi:hypothetical protein